MTYEIRNGKIQIERCELDIVHHCNLSCRACTHLSPWAAKCFADPDQVVSDLSVLAEYCHLKGVGLLGGEPLLHPDLLGVVDAIRKSGLVERIAVVTNGVLLGRMPEAFWRSVDVVVISLYPGSEISVEELKVCRQRAREHGADLKLKYQDSFRESHSALGTTDAHLVRRIYSTCKAAHAWRCHTAIDGYFYRCPRSAFIPRYLHSSPWPNVAIDGLKIEHSGTFVDDLLSFLSRETPLESCRYCLGTVGKRFAHTQESRSVSRALRPTEELVDWGHLEELEKSDNLLTPPWLGIASTLAKRVVASLPPAIQMHPAMSRLIAAARHIHPALQY
jgi:cyclic pyranopterin phosphate synthase